jgi:hypothetical protein
MYKRDRHTLEQVYQERIRQTEIMLAKSLTAQSHLIALEWKAKYEKCLKDLDKEG